MKRLGLIVMVLVFLSNTKVYASEIPTKIRCTCYTSSEGSITASGDEVREGIVAAKRSWMGNVVVLYDMNMNLIGYFEIKDTGAGIDTDGDGKGDSIKKGLSIDVYRDTLQGCRDWTKQYGDYVYMYMFEGCQG